jgi:hypothetical protein
VSERQEKRNATSDGTTGRFDRWRDEIRHFYEQVVADVQRIISAIDRSAATSYSRALPREQAAVPPPAPVVEVDSNRDASQDRLAQLKRQLAAKLSKSVSDESHASR